MLSWCHHLPNASGKFYALKGAVREEELTDLPDNFSIDTIVELKVPELDEQRHLVILSLK